MSYTQPPFSVSWLQMSIMIVNKKAVCAAALSLLQIILVCCDAQNPYSQCEDEICHIYTDNFGQLQKVISSNRHIILNGVEFNVNGSNGFTVIENVSNLTISSAEEEGSIINCSSESTFGLHLKNATNILLTGITITNCASYIPTHAMQYEYSASQCIEATVLIETPRNINLSKVHIKHSLGVALAIFDSIFQGPSIAMDVVNFNLTLINCTISHSREESLVMFGTISLLIEGTLITNSSRGINSYKADILIKNFDVSNCTSSSVVAGHVMVTEGLQITNSSLTISESIIIFTGDKSISGLTVIESVIFVKKNSVLQFQRFSSTFLILILTQSFLTLDNSTMIFTQNNVDPRALFRYSHMSVSNGSTLSITNNTLTNGTLMLWNNCSIIVNCGILLIEENKCQDSNLILAINTTITWENGSNFNFKHNTIITHSTTFYLLYGLMNFSESFLVARKNSLSNFGLVLYYENSSLVINTSKLLLDDNKCHDSSSLLNAYLTTIRMEMGTLINCTHNEVYSYSVILASVFNESSLLVSKNKFEASSSIIYFKHNTILTASTAFDLWGGWMNFSESSLVANNNSLSNKGVVFQYYHSSLIINASKLLFDDNKCHDSMLLRAISTTIRMEMGTLINCTHNEMYSDSVIFHSESFVVFNESSLLISNNNFETSSSIFWFSTLNLIAGKWIFEKNKCHANSYLVVSYGAQMIMENDSLVTFAHNEMDNSVTFHYFHSTWKMSSDSNLQLLNNTASGTFTSTNSVFSGRVRVTNNYGIYYGAISFFSSVIWFNGNLEVVGNRGGVSGGFILFGSEIYITESALFLDNYAETNGGAISLFSSVMHVSNNAVVNFTKNYAQQLGGAIYISEPTISFMDRCDSSYKPRCEQIITCSIQLAPHILPENCQFFSLTFNQNKAGTAGNAIYGGHTSACLQCGKDIEDICHRCLPPDGSDLFHYNGVNDSSDLSNFTSHPTRVCFCENDIPNCYKVLSNITVYPGENFNLSLAIIGYGLGTVPGSVIANRSRSGESQERISEQSVFGSESQYFQEVREAKCQNIEYSIVSERDGEQISLAVDSQSLSIPLKVVQSVLNFKLTGQFGDISSLLIGHSSFYEDFFYIPVFVEVDLLACPVGFQLVRGRCVCHRILLDNKIDTCFFSNGTGLIPRPVPYWIGLPSDTNFPILIHPYCPLDYCKSRDINITAESPNTQCQYQRSGVLCGSCREGLSMMLGSSECRNCSNVYLVSISFFILCGVALVTILTLLNLTVSVGTLNGLILFANILQANRTAFLPLTTSHTSATIAFLRTFIAWLNLDLGIPICFFDGLTTYVKTWLQFVFLLYVFALVGVMIIASNYSTRVTRLLGKNAVSVLATLVLLSYTKSLRILITAFSFTTLTGSQDYHSVVWLADGNIKYFEPKHAILFLVALLVLLLLGIPYTVTLIAAPWIQRSRFRWVSSLYNRFKPLFDAYMGPYKDRHRYWTGMLLLARVVLIVLFSSIANTNTVAGPQLNLLLLSLTSCGLISLTAAFKPYKNKLLNGLEIFHLTILFILSSSNLYVSNNGTGIGPHAYIYIILVGICFLVFLGICVGHVWYRIRKTTTGRRPQAPEREEDDYRPLIWKRTRVRAEDEEEREELILFTGGATNTISHGWRRESLVELIADIPE